MKSIGKVSIIHWNPRIYRLPRPLGRIRFGPRTNNFGDLLGPLIAQEMLKINGLIATPNDKSYSTRLLTVGSILHFAQDHDVIWGTGINGKISLEELKFSTLDVKAVRGPRTAQILTEHGIAVPNIYGDPALLIPHLFPSLKTQTEKKERTTAYVPNLHDEEQWKDLPGLVSPKGVPADVIKSIISAEQVITSSLHGLIIAEAFGVPVQVVASRVENQFKYYDYIEGTGRSELRSVSTIDEAQLRHRKRDILEPLNFDSKALLSSFPLNLWI